MELYGRAATILAGSFTNQYSTSFSSASRLFPIEMRRHIYNIYGLVRIADEIVDTYKGADQAALLDGLEAETYAAIKRGFSPNPLVHAFAITAQTYDISKDLIVPFFDSMRMDLNQPTYTTKAYREYIYGSAEVVGLMCLKVFCAGNTTDYKRLASGAQRLGAAYQKVNFLRDIAADYHELNRFYFPNMAFSTLTDADKQTIIKDIQADFTAAKPYIKALPKSARSAVGLSYRYYRQLLMQLEKTPLETLKTTRVRVAAGKKVQLLLSAKVGISK